MIGGLLNTVLGALTSLGYPGIAAIVGLESAGLPLPGETTLLAASYLAATGHLSLPLVIASATLGAVVGDSVGYFIGHKGGRRFLERYGRYVGITPKKLAKADGVSPATGARRFSSDASSPCCVSSLVRLPGHRICRTGGLSRRTSPGPLPGPAPWESSASTSASRSPRF